MTTETGRMKLGKKPKGPAFSTHCLRRKQVRVVPHATFRRFAMESTSYNALLPFLEHRDFLRARALDAALRANAANLNLGKA